MHKSHYIPNSELPATVTGNRQLSGFASSIVDLLSGNRRGQAFTWALNGVDLSTDPAALQAAYDANPEAINGYLQYVDIDKILSKVTASGEQEQYGLDWWRRRVPAFLIGAGLAGAGFTLFNTIKK